MGDNTVVTWAVGHVLEQAAPDVYDEKHKKWNSADLPRIPENWQLIVSERTKKQFKSVKDLIKKADEIVKIKFLKKFSKSHDQFANKKATKP